MTQEQADAKYQEFIDAKEAKVAARFEQTRAEVEAHHKMVFGSPKKAATQHQGDAEALAEFQEGSTEEE